MTNILINFLKKYKKCSHKNALLNTQEGYCPDCGEYLVKNYYIVRCACCKVKREAKIYWGEIVPADKFCTNCGSSEYYIEKTDKINFIDANWAIYLKETVNETKDSREHIQIWVENTENIKYISECKKKDC